MLSKMRSERGFTLIELMVVVLIIAILIGIAIPLFNVARANAQRRTCQANLRTIDGAINTYNAGNEVYPPTGSLDGSHVLVTGGYLKSAPRCPTDSVLYNIAGGTPPYSVCQSAGVTNHSY